MEEELLGGREGLADTYIHTYIDNRAQNSHCCCNEDLIFTAGIFGTVGTGGGHAARIAFFNL